VKVVIVARSKRHTRIYYYFKQGFRQAGHQARWLKYPKLKRHLGTQTATAVSAKMLALFKPDLLFVHALDISRELLLAARRYTKIVMYFDDCLTTISEDKFKTLISFARLADIFYITNRGEIPIYQEQGVTAKFITGGCDPGAHHMVKTPPAKYQSEVAFIGKPSTPERVACMREVAGQFDLKLWGGRWETVGLQAAAKNAYAAEYRKLCAGAKIVLGWNVDSTIDLYFSNRTWYTLGCGGFLLTAYSPNLEELFGRGVELDWFETVDECLKKIRYYLDHDDERKKIALAGYRLAHRQYRYRDLAQYIIKDCFGDNAS
jgi:spore maturation protein CgeB